MIVVATWPMRLPLQPRLLSRRWRAEPGKAFLLLAILVLPFSLAICAVMEHFKEISAWTTSLANFTPPPPPDWLGKIPLIGARAAVRWQQVTELSHEELAARLTPYVGGIAR